MRALASIVLLFAAAGCTGSPELELSGGAIPLPPPPAPQGVLLLLDPKLSGSDEREALEKIEKTTNAASLERVGDSAIFILSLPPGANSADVLQELEDNVNVLVSEPDYVASAPEGGPDEIPILGSDLLASIRVQPSLASLRLDEAHAFSRGSGVVVAVVDTGVDFTHPLIANQLRHDGFDFIGQDADPSDERDFADNDGDGEVDEQYGHGTFIASLVLTVAPEARILPVRVLDAEGFGTSSTIAAGIVWAVDRGADIINISVDIAKESEVVKDAISYAKNRRVLVVAAAGNHAASGVVFPAKFGDVVAVTAADASGLAPFANYGSGVDLAAPGVDLVGAVPFDLSPMGSAHWSGTSFATPIVSGTAALVASAFSFEESPEIRDRLFQTALAGDESLGHGLVQPLDAVR